MTPAAAIVAACRSTVADVEHIVVGDAVITVRTAVKDRPADNLFDAFARRHAEIEHAPAAPIATVHVAFGPLRGLRFSSLPVLSTDLGHRPLPEEEVVTVIGGESPAVYAATADRREAAVWFPLPTRRAMWERARPLLPALQAVLRDTPWSVLHAAAVGRDQRATLLTGGSHAGKTTLSLAALLAGEHFFGDDVVGVALDPPRVARIYDSARLRLPAHQALAELVGEGVHSEELGEERRELRLTQRLAGTPTTAVIDRLVHLERRGAASPTFGPVSRARVISTVTATTLQVSFGDLRHRLVVTDLCAALPPRGLDPGAGLAAAVGALLTVPPTD